MSNFSNGFFHTDVPDQIANFMDYGNIACSNEFTQGQANRMMAVIMTQRSSLLQDECTPPCIENIIASFTRDISYSINVGKIYVVFNDSGTTMPLALPNTQLIELSYTDNIYKLAANKYR